jgi:hypothetical protein
MHYSSYNEKKLQVEPRNSKAKVTHRHAAPNTPNAMKSE